MNKIKSLVIKSIAILTVMAMMVGCSATKDVDVIEEGKLNVVTTIFPLYDFTRAIVTDDVELTMLMSPGLDTHSFDPTPKDIITIHESDVFIYIGGDEDVWVESVLDTESSKDRVVIRMMDYIDVLEEEIVEGMEHDHDHDHDHGHDHHHSHEINAEDIEVRQLDDFQGSWQSVHTYFEDGTLDEYIAHTAEENETTATEQKANLLERRTTEYKNIDITDTGLTVYTDMGNESGNYSYAEYRPVYNDDGDIRSVWYVYEITEPTGNMPTYLAFNDHEIKPHSHDEHDEELAHFHMRYGSDSIDALIDVENWAPTFYPVDATAEDIEEALIAHDHSHDHGHDHDDHDHDHDDHDHDHDDHDHDHDDHDHDHDDHDHDHHHHHDYDEHIWTSPSNAIQMINILEQELSKLQPQHADEHRANADKYIEEIEQLEQEMRAVIEVAENRMMVFGDRFPFRYLVEEYDIEYYAAFSGCSTQTDASAATMTFLIDKIRDENLPAVFHIEGTSHSIARTISEETGVPMVQMHSYHTVTNDEFDSGITYTDLMRDNIEALKEGVK